MIECDSSARSFKYSLSPGDHLVDLSNLTFSGGGLEFDGGGSLFLSNINMFGTGFFP